MKIFLVSVSFLLSYFVSDSFAQSLNPGEWRTYTSMRSVQDIALASDSIHVWAVTSGGAFRANIRDTSEPLFALRTTDGLTENDLTSVAIDGNGNVFFGGRTGGFDVYRASTEKVEKLGSDIVSSDHPDKTIHSLSISGDTVFLATAYGIGVYKNVQPGYFALTVGTIGSLPPSDSVAQVLNVGGYVYAAMNEGVAYASNKIDLYSNSNWTLIPDTSAVRSLAVFGGSLYVGAANGLFMVSPDRKTLIPIPLPVNTVVSRLSASRDSLFILDGSNRLFSTHDLQNFATRSLISSAGGFVNVVKPTPNNTLALGTASDGMEVSTSGQYPISAFPSGPIGNNVTSISFATATDQLYVSNFDLGIDAFKPVGGIWTDYVAGVGTTPTRRFYTLTYDSIRNVTWIGDIGDGFFKVSNLGTGPLIWDTITPTKNGVPQFFGGAPDYLIAEGGILNSAGQFIMPTWAKNGRGISITSDGEHFNSFPINDPSPDQGLPYGCVTQDLEGNYWVGTVVNNSPKSYGVFWVRAADSVYGNIAGGSGALINDPAVNAILTDQDDGIWCGTEGGVQIISNPSAILDATPRFSIRTVPLLASQIVHSMAVDGVGNKWIGTENGIFVVSPDGSDSVARFSKQNSPLIDDHINSLAIDSKRGEAYAATPFGISRFSTIFKQGNPDYSNIHVFPNPVVQTAASDEVNPLIHIDGLVAGSTVKIFSLNMKLIASINGTALGSTVTWSGRDDLGRQVPSGMYLITATSPQSGENGQAKVVIVRKP